MIKYALAMGIRMVCLVLIFVLDGWFKIIPVAGAVFLPWIAVVIANGDDMAEGHSDALLDSAPLAELEARWPGPRGAGSRQRVLQGELINDDDDDTGEGGRPREYFRLRRRTAPARRQPAHSVPARPAVRRRPGNCCGTTPKSTPRSAARPGWHAPTTAAGWRTTSRPAGLWKETLPLARQHDRPWSRTAECTVSSSPANGWVICCWPRSLPPPACSWAAGRWTGAPRPSRKSTASSPTIPPHPSLSRTPGTSSPARSRQGMDAGGAAGHLRHRRAAHCPQPPAQRPAGL